MLGAGLVLVLVGWGGTRLVLQSSQQRAEAERIENEARAYADATGRSMDVALAVSELCIPPERLVGLSAKKLDRLARKYEQFQDADRLHVARYCVGLFHSPVIKEFDDRQLAVAQEVISSIIMEYAHEPQIIGIAFGVAGELGLGNDPFLVDIASETMMNDDIPQEVRRFVFEAFLRPAEGTSHVPDG